MNRTIEFHSDWASMPGATISALLDDKQIALPYFAQQMSLSLEAVEELLTGHMRITAATARKLSDVLGASPSFWERRDLQYLADIARLKNAPIMDDAKNWLQQLPIKQMIEFDWIPPSTGLIDRAVSCLQFFGVPDIKAWQKKYANDATQFAAFRRSSSFELKRGAVAAWLRKGEIEAAKIDCAPWNSKLFRESLQAIRRLTRKNNPAVFLPELVSLCAACGVAVVILRAPAGCPTSGATRFLTDDKALLLLSFRYLSDDHFWFSFFHEAGHLLRHGKRSLFLEGLNISSEQEMEANIFASYALVPADRQEEMSELPPKKRAVMRFAKEIGVSAGIVVGQMQHRQLIGPKHLNFLKRRFQWEN